MTDVLPDGAPQNQLFHNLGNGTFENVSNQSGVDPSGRTLGVATADYDRDGWVDFVIGDYERGYSLYRNNRAAGTVNDRISVHLAGRAPVNTDAIGARVYVETSDGKRQVHECQSGSSLGGGNSMALHFGLGGAELVLLLFRQRVGDDVEENVFFLVDVIPQESAQPIGVMNEVHAVVRPQRVVEAFDTLGPQGIALAAFQWSDTHQQQIAIDWRPVEINYANDPAHSDTLTTPCFKRLSTSSSRSCSRSRTRDFYTAKWALVAGITCPGLPAISRLARSSVFWMAPSHRSSAFHKWLMNRVAARMKRLVDCGW